MRRMLGICCLLAVVSSGAEKQPFMVLRWGRSGSDAPADPVRLFDALGRYPSCFDTVRFYGKPPDGQTSEALRKGLETMDRLTPKERPMMLPVR